MVDVEPLVRNASQERNDRVLLSEGDDQWELEGWQILVGSAMTKTTTAATMKAWLRAHLRISDVPDLIRKRLGLAMSCVEGGGRHVQPGVTSALHYSHPWNPKPKTTPVYASVTISSHGETSYTSATHRQGHPLGLRMVFKCANDW